jgi:uncharacterized protein YaiI (UPF0178 family)
VQGTVSAAAGTVPVPFSPLHRYFALHRGGAQEPGRRKLLEIYVDADACPVKEEVYRVARRCALKVHVVANRWMAIPGDPLFDLVVVGAGDDVADDWIAGRVGKGDIVVTADVLLADRCLKASARVVDAKGHEFTDDSIGSQVAGRELTRRLREAGIETGGPSAMTTKDRGKFLNTLDAIVQSVRRSSIAQ